MPGWDGEINLNIYHNKGSDSRKLQKYSTTVTIPLDS